jgi:hypothetical protein
MYRIFQQDLPEVMGEDAGIENLNTLFRFVTFIELLHLKIEIMLILKTNLVKRALSITSNILVN